MPKRSVNSNLDNIRLRRDKVRHSLAHLLAATVLKKFPKAQLGVGPVIEDGFYYDFLLPRTLTPDDLKEFEKAMRDLIKQNLPFSGKKITPAVAKKTFEGQRFKLDLIKQFTKEKQALTTYSTGTVFTDLCRGGHVKNTKEIDPEGFKLTKTAGAYWRGDEKNPQLQRVYGVAFASKKDLEAYLKLQEEIEKRDHRKLGERLDLFSSQDIAPGAPFWHPKGMIIFRELEKMIRGELDKEGYQEISTPIMVKHDVFEKSGHWKYYRDSMFYFRHGEETLVLKPMNCPESTYIYNARTRSYRDLPLRLAEIGRLHRNELSGTLGGLLRVRQITMDDAHIYLRPDQIQSEISSLLKLVKKVYGLFGFPTEFFLATKPKEALGDPKLWTKAEKALEMALQENKVSFKIKPKDGAFYGPKIDIHIKDVLGRDWQLATIQLDLVMLPERFNLSYADEAGRKQKPVVIHRAIFGSFERFIGILIEHFAGALPLWLSPVQAEIINVGSGQRKYAGEAYEALKASGFRARLSDENLTVGKRIREAEMQKIPYILVVGEKEVANRTVNVRHYRRGQEGERGLGKLVEKMREEIEGKII
ncbi:threonine--tRNA ligase [Candidatus Parcubacteria bacterium]|nr:MAG: threonine--tRNA ligase [Candidatus Parcubacteria bacterium]